MTWQPGQPVVTENDHTDWQIWRKERALELQRGRRNRLWRIDYYPDRKAARILATELEWQGANTSIHETLDRIIREWAELPELNGRE